MANLNFKWGLHKNLPQNLTEEQIGALFFTKDEGALYLGVEAGKKPQRIQGVVQYYASLSAFKAEVLPPYSSDVIYYIADQNALVRWDGNKVNEDGETEGRFVVLNVTASEFDTKITAIESDISINAGNIAANTGDITSLKTNLGLANAEAGDGTAFARIKQLENAVDALEELTGTGSGDNSLSNRLSALETWKNTTSGQIESLEGDLAIAQGNISTAQNDIKDLKTSTESHDNSIKTINTNITNLQNANSGILSRLDQAESDIDKNTIAIGTNEEDIAKLQGTVNGHNESINQLSINLNGANEKIGNLESLTGTQGTAISKNTEDIAAAVGRIATNEGDISSMEGDIARIDGLAKATSALVGAKTDDATKDSAFGQIAALKAADTATSEAATALAGRVSTAEGTIIEHTTSIGKLETFKTNAEKDIASLQGDVASKAEASVVTTLSSRVDTIVGENTTRDQKIDKNSTDIAKVNTKIGDIGENTTVAAVINAVAGDVSTNLGKINKNIEDIGTLNDLTDDHSKAINNINDEIAGIKVIDGQQTEKISTLEKWKTTTSTTIENLEKDLGTAQGQISANTAKFSNYYTKTEVDGQHSGLKTELETKLTNEINAANSLTYIKGIGSSVEWDAVKSAPAAIGDTYVVTESNIFLDLGGSSSVACYAGDLLIATAKAGKAETDGELAVADTEWVHVKAGYQKELESEIRVIDGDGADVAKKATIQLTSYPAKQAGNFGDMGAVSIVTDSNNLEVAVSGSDVKISMVWDTF